jgi:hypothetical protein
MDRHTFRITSRGQLLTAFKYAGQQAYPFMVEVRDVTRNDKQNAMLWPLLKAFSEQVEIRGQRLGPDQMKAVLMHAWGQEVETLPTLDGKSWFPVGFRSSTLTKPEFSSLLSFIEAEAATRGVEVERDVSA